MKVICKISDRASHAEEVWHVLRKDDQQQEGCQMALSSFPECFLDNDLRSPRGFDVAQ